MPCESPETAPVPILHDRLPLAAWMDPRTHRLPGVQPLAREDWLLVDEAYGAQMAERDRLIAECPDAVHALLPGARPAAGELLDTVLADLARRTDFAIGTDRVRRPDGVEVTLDRALPLITLGRLVQADFCLMERPASATEHVLTGAILCFPSSWTLAQKLGRPLIAIHAPVARYDADIAKRVQRLFDAIRPDAPLWRANTLPYHDPTLFQPRREYEAKSKGGGTAPFLRSERQCLMRLPRTQAVVFSIHTWQVRRESLSEAARLALEESFAEGAGY